MSLPWLKDDYKRPGSAHSSSRSRSRSGSRGRRGKSDRKSKSRSRSRSRSSGRDRSRRGVMRDRGGFKRGGARGRNPDRGDRKRRRRSNSSSSASQTSGSRSPTRLAASNRPKYVNARVFVANILSKDVTKEQLVNHFEKYGNVVDVLIHAKNYAFIQYLKEDHAKLAVEGENGSVFNGMRIDVKMANENRKGGGGQSHRGGRGGAAGGGPDRDRLPPNDPGRDPYAPDPYMHDAGRMPFPPPPPIHGEFGRDPFYPDPYRRPYPPDPWIDDPYRRDPYADPYRDPYAPRAPPPPMECVVFYVNRQLQTYAETIERMIKDQSVITTSAIIPEGRTAPQMIDDLSSRGGLFAIFINAQNDTHRSLTLNILHGTPQEHRNMPLDDAITLIGRSFEKYVEDLRAKANANSSKPEPAAPPPAPVAGSGASNSVMTPTSEIKYLLNLLADNQALTIQELDEVIQYLKYRRDKLLETEKGPSVAQDSAGPSRRQAEDMGYPDRRSPEMKRDAGYGKVSPSRNMDRGYPDRAERGHPDRAERGPSEGAYRDRSSYDRDRPPAGDRYEKERSPDRSKPIHEELTKKILSIFQGGNPDIISQFSSAPPVTAPAPAPAPAPPPPSSSSASSSSANLINFDNPNVQKALDNLIQSGPNLLKSITPKLSSAQTSLATSGGGGGGATSGKSDGDKNGYGQPPAPNQGPHQGQQMMDPHMPPGMYMEDMQAHMAGMGMPAHGRSQGSMHHHMSMAGQMQQMASHYMMQGMGGMPGQSDGYGPMAGYQGASGPPLPRGAPPPPPPPHQQF